MTYTRRTLEKKSKIIMYINIFVMYQGCPSHILSMPFIEQPYALGTPMDIGESTNKILP